LLLSTGIIYATLIGRNNSHRIEHPIALVSTYAPENFIPLVWSDYDEGTVKLLKVPIPITVRKDK